MNVAKSIGFVWFGFAVSVVVVFVMTPHLIGKLGPEKYGFWILLQSLTGYYGLIDMGLRSGITQSVTWRIARGDRSALTSFISGILPTVLRTASFVFLVVFCIGAIVPWVFDINSVSKWEIFGIVVIQGFGIFFTILTFPFSSILPGSGRYDLSEGIAIILRVVSSIFLWVSLLFSSSLLTLAIIGCVFNLVDQIIRCFVALRLVPELMQVRPKRDSKEVSELYRVGGWTFLFQVSQNVLTTFNALIVGYWFSVVALVPYNLSFSLADYVGKITTLASRVLYPEFVRIKHLGDLVQTRLLYHISSRLALAISLGGLISGYIWFETFMGIWLDEVEGNAKIISEAKVLYLIFAAMNIVGAIRAIGFQLLGSENLLSFMGKSTLLEAILTVIVAVVFASLFGVIGPPLANLLVITLSTLFIACRRYSKLLQEAYGQFLFSISYRPLIFSILGGGLLVLWKRYAGAINTWGELFVLGALPTICIFLLVMPVLFKYSEMVLFANRLGNRR